MAIIAPNLIGIFGGTFDPVHFGHLRTALELLQDLNLREVRYIPCRDPVHKNKAQANAPHRLQMLKIAVAEEPQLVIDTRELDRQTPSYMLETLQSLHADFPEATLCLVVGIDALQSLPGWYCWQQLFDYAHIIGIARPAYHLNLTGELDAFLQDRIITDPNKLTTQRNGYVLLKTTALFEISSTDIRRLILSKKNPHYLLPDTVLNYIYQHRLYCD
jgi:nicotinate-nucleotide adenylyltransferase